MTDRQRTAALADDRLPALAELLTDRVPGPLATAVAAAEGTVTAVRVRQVTWWPGRSATVSWDTVVEGGPLAGRATYVGTTLTTPEGARVAGTGADSVTVWRVPHDPFLPALAAVLQPSAPDAVAGAVASTVVGAPVGHLSGTLEDTLGGPATELRTRLRAYRPTRRAVVDVRRHGDEEADAHVSTAHLKLVRPHRLSALHRRHLELVGLLPVPEPLGIDADLGLLVLRHLPGRTLRAALEDPGATLPHPDVVADLPSRLPELPHTSTVPSAVEAAARIGDLLRRLLPTEAGRIDRVVDAVGEDDVADRVPAHGDYHEAQLLIDPEGQVSGILDVDTLGLGRPADDAGTMLGHLAVWRTMSGQPDRVGAYAFALQQRWESRLDPAEVRRRAAARILGLAVGPFRVQQAGWPVETSRRLALAEKWLPA